MRCCEECSVRLTNIKTSFSFCLTKSIFNILLPKGLIASGTFKFWSVKYILETDLQQIELMRTIQQSYCVFMKNSIIIFYSGTFLCVLAIRKVRAQRCDFDGDQMIT